MTHVCADCGKRTEKENGPCVRCGQFRIVSIAFIEKTFGPDWVKAFDEDEIDNEQLQRSGT